MPQRWTLVSSTLSFDLFEIVVDAGQNARVAEDFEEVEANLHTIFKPRRNVERSGPAE